MPSAAIGEALVERLYRAARAERWQLPAEVWREAIEIGVGRAFPDREPARRDLDRHLSSLHLDDLALACACAQGHEGAWDHFVRELRPVLYRAADTLEPGGGARDLADSLYADLYGLAERGTQRKSLFRYFHGRSSLATWLRAVLAQRHVDRVRSQRRLDPLPDDDSAAPPAASGPSDPDRLRYLELLQRALEAALAGLAPRDRLRLGCYYAQGLTLAQIGRLLGEHEGTVSRHLARTRRALREQIEAQLRRRDRLTEAELQACFESVASDPGPIDLERMLVAGKLSGQDRSK